MDIILLENIRGLGVLGDTVKVKAGYGRNYLLPQGKAVAATEDNVKYFNERRADLEAKAADALTRAKGRATQLEELSVSITAKAGDEGKLFGSIGTRDIADAVTAAGVEVDKREVRLPEGALRQVGEYEVTLALHAEVNATLKLLVLAEA